MCNTSKTNWHQIHKKYDLKKKLNSSFLYDLHHGQVPNEHQYIEKMFQSAIIKGLWVDFTIFWIT